MRRIEDATFFFLAHRGILWVNSKADMGEAPDSKRFFEV
jgi:hypothetical protein